MIGPTPPATEPTSSGRPVGKRFRPPVYPWDVLVATITVTLLGLTWVLPFGGFLHDEGQFAQSADRLLAGDLPHRDYDDPYAGLSTVLHAAGLTIFGHRLDSLRWMMLAVLVPVIGVMFDLVLRLAGPQTRRPLAAAAVMTVAAFGASVGATHAAHVNQYLMMAAVACLWAVVRSGESRGWRTLAWAAAAGGAAGVSVCLKLTGLFTVAAGGVAMLAVARVERTPGDRMPDEQKTGGPKTGGPAAMAIAAAVSAAAVLLSVAVVGRLPTPRMLAFFGPALAATAVLPFLLARGLCVSGWLKRAAAYGAAAVLPPAAGVLLYAANDALPWLWRGLVELPTVRFETAAAVLQPPAPTVAALCLPVAIVCGSSARRRPPLARMAAIAYAGILALWVTAPLFQTFGPLRTRLAVEAWRWLPAVLAAGGAVILLKSRGADGVRSSEGGRANVDPRPLAVVTPFVAFFALHQFPFAQPLYAAYGLPLTAVMLVAWSRAAGVSAWRPAAVLTLLLAAGIARYGDWGVYREFQTAAEAEPPPADLSGLVFAGPPVRILDGVLRHLDRLPEDALIVAGPDCPEVYFLSGRENPTRLIYDFFEDREDPQAAFLERALWPHVTAVVVNRDPGFSEAIAPPTLRTLYAAFPKVTDYERFAIFERAAGDDANAE